MADIIEDAGYLGLEASDGVSALTILRSEEQIDLLITDVGLPGGLNGRQIADAARVVRPKLKIIFVTGYAEASVMKDIELDATMRVISKPFSTEELTQEIKKILAG